MRYQLRHSPDAPPARILDQHGDAKRKASTGEEGVPNRSESYRRSGSDGRVARVVLA